MIGALDLSIGWVEAGLFLVVVVTGAWNTAVGPTGGVTFATMSVALSPAVAIPVQAIVEGVSGLYRGWELRRHIDLNYLWLFALGGTVGVAFSYRLLDELASQPDPDRFDSVFTLLVAGLILLTTWLPIAHKVAERNAAPIFVGVTTSAVSLFVGGMGAAISASLASRGEPHSTVLATSTMAVMALYAGRLATFGLIGFSLAGNLTLTVLLTIGSVIGTLIGKRALYTVDHDKAAKVFKVVVTAIAISMIMRVAIDG